MIKQISPLWAYISPQDKDFIKIYRLFEYQEVYWGPKKIGFGKERAVRTVSIIAKRGWFGAGLIPLIEEKYPEIEIKKIPKNDISFPLHLNGKRLRGYQALAVRKALKENRGIIESPTGSGKTLIAAALINAIEKATEEGCLFIVNTTPLFRQSIKSLENLLEKKIGKIGSGQTDIEETTVATIQSLTKKENIKEILKGFSGIIIDEAHHSAAKTYQDILHKTQCEYRFGLTATPHKLWTTEEYLKVTRVLGPIVSTTKYAHLSQKEYLAAPLVILYSSPKIKVDGNWHSAYNEGIVNNIGRNMIIKEIAQELIKQNKTILIQVRQTVHGENIKNILPEAILIEGKTKEKVQEKTKQALDNKETKAVISTTVWKEGVDIPNLDCVINAGAGKGEIATIQSVGRVLRPKKHKAIIVDFIDNGKYLKAHSKARQKIYESLEWEISNLTIKNKLKKYKKSTFFS